MLAECLDTMLLQCIADQQQQSVSIETTVNEHIKDCEASCDVSGAAASSCDTSGAADYSAQADDTHKELVNCDTRGANTITSQRRRGRRGGKAHRAAPAG
jgi:hypothetical protein